MLNCIDAYRKLDSFAMTIEHSDSSGLFPGRFKQSLVWAKGGKFALQVTQKTDFKPTSSQPGTVAPDYFSDGTQISVVEDAAVVRKEDVTPRPNTSPGWEVSGGLVLSILQNTEMVKTLLDPPVAFKATYSFGPTKTFETEKVIDVQLKFVSGPNSQTVDVFIAQDNLLVGIMYDSHGKHWAHYSHRTANPPTPADLGIYKAKFL